jgi:HK97 family phage prohead protease
MEPTKIRDMDLVRAVSRTPELRAAEDDQDDVLGVLEVRFSVFNSWYEIEDWWEGRFLERTAPGAFAKTIKDNGTNFRVQFDHGHDPTIGSKILGPIRSLEEAKDSPVGVVDLLDTSYNRDLLPGLRRGLYGSSFRFRVVKEEWNDEPGRSDHNPDGVPERTITEVRLFEFGPVTWPANPDATAGMRSGTGEYLDRLRGAHPDYVTRMADLVRSRRSTPRPGADPVTPEPQEPREDATEPRPALHGLTARRRKLVRAQIGI